MKKRYLDKDTSPPYTVIVYFKGSEVRILLYPVTVIGKILPWSECSGAVTGGKAGKAGKKIARKTGDFGICKPRFFIKRIFKGFEEKPLKNRLSQYFYYLI